MDAVASAMVLCAGLGTRLRPLTEELPKPLVPLGDRPVLAHIADQLRAAGFDRMVVNTHHLKGEFNNISRQIALKVELIHEPEIRGTAGGLCGARQLLSGPPVLLWNGDIAAAPPIADLLSSAAGGGLCLAVAPRPVGEGTVGLNVRGHVVRLRGQVFGSEARSGDYIGVAGVGKRLLDALPEVGCLIGDVALVELAQGGIVETADVSGSWSDLGDPRSYHAANMQWLEREAGGRLFLGEGAQLAEEVDADMAIIGAGAVVQGSGAFRRVVLWPGAQARAPLQDAIVSAAGHVVPVA